MELATARLGCALRRLGRAPSLPDTPPPLLGRRSRTLTLYEYEASPFCKRVREAACALALTVQMRPCARSTLLREGVVGDSPLRAEARALLPPSEPLRFPLLCDRPTAEMGSDSGAAERRVQVMLESREIVAHLWVHYGDESSGAASVRSWLARTAERAARIRPYVPGGSTTRLRNLVNLMSDEDMPGLFGASLARPFAHAGLAAARSTAVDEGVACATNGSDAPVRELWAFEACARATLVREALCSLGLRYTLHGMGGAPNAPAAARQLGALRAAHGADARPPFLVDARAGVAGSGEFGGWEPLVARLWQVYCGDGQRPSVAQLLRRDTKP
ncbi:hypothetical protein KFE25_005800 [Diacronema lutheri]|uniref:GST N-terminal domain-containing protein n=1 Tax=Diacronema lutheri TaxID=2081491 RepID=A0A8J5XBR9_DIALT|nr:hypothetical protein KFE25_005800 [Diacronema lutheri]